MQRTYRIRSDQSRILAYGGGTAEAVRNYDGRYQSWKGLFSHLLDPDVLCVEISEFLDSRSGRPSAIAFPVRTGCCSSVGRASDDDSRTSESRSGGDDALSRSARLKMSAHGSAIGRGNGQNAARRYRRSENEKLKF